MQKLENRAYNKAVKSYSYVSGKMIGFNSIYIKIKPNQNLKAKFFDLFQVFYLGGK